MKKVLFIALLAALPATASAQCTPDTSYIIPDVYPDSLEHAFVDSPYTAVVDFRTPPPDTNVGAFPATIDSLEITGFSGLPAGFTYDCNRADCMYYPDENGCVAITGTPTASQFGNHPLTGYIKIYFRVLGSPGTIVDTVDQFTLKVCYWPDSCYKDTTVSVTQLPDAEAAGMLFYPNPASSIVRLKITMLAEAGGIYRVFDVMGREVFSRKLVSGTERFSFDLSGLPDGIYMQTVIAGNNIRSKRLVKSSTE